MLTIRFFIACCLLPLFLSAQPTGGLVARYTFNDCTANDNTGNGSDGALFGMPNCECGVDSSALLLDGNDDYGVFFGSPVNAVFNQPFFTLAFYFKTTSAGGTSQSLFSKRSGCNLDNILDIRVRNLFERIDIDLAESSGRRITLRADLPNTCWVHLAVTRQNNTLTAYINGKESASTTLTGNNLSIVNNAVTTFSNSPCIGIDGTVAFEGLLDEVNIYNRALNAIEVEELYNAYAPDQILNTTQLIYDGVPINTFIGNTCATDFLWQPSAFVADSTAPETTITPNDTTTYTLAFIDDYGCISVDTLQINVLNPADFDCDNIFLPGAFTPNGDNLNETFGISNAPVIQALESFEIFDRWGNRLFTTNDVFAQWDGTIRGERLSLGTYLYRLVYSCSGSTFTKTGSVTLIR